MTAPNRGTKNFKAKLTEKQVAAIYLAKGKFTQQRIADQHKVSKSTVASILNGRSWGWLTVKLNGGRELR